VVLTLLLYSMAVHSFVLPCRWFPVCSFAILIRSSRIHQKVTGAGIHVKNWTHAASTVHLESARQFSRSGDLILERSGDALRKQSGFPPPATLAKT